MTDREMKLEHDKPFWGLGEVIGYSWPAVLSMLNGTLMTFVDGMMVSKIDGALAGQFTGGIITFIPQSLGLGVLGIINTFVSQNYGSKNFHKCSLYVWAAFLLATIYSIAVQVLHLPAGAIFTAMGQTGKVHSQATLYAHYMIANTWFFLMARVMENFFFGLGRTKVVLVTSVLANVCNVGVNYVLIFGKFGFPEMGLEGAAIGTLCGSALLMLLMMWVYFGKELRKRYDTFNFRGLTKEYSREIVKIGLPAGIHFCSDIATWALFTTYLVGKFGDIALTANTVVVRYLSLSFMPAVGISISATALVGRYIGMGRKDIARKRARAAVLAGVIYMVCCGVLFYIFREELMRFYIGSLSQFESGESKFASLGAAQIEEIVGIGCGLMIFAACFQFADAMAIVYSGALKGTGDTLWPMLVTGAASWAVMVGGGLTLVHLVPELREKAAWIAAMVDIIVLGGLICWRFESGKWEKIDLLKQPADPIQLDTDREH